MKHLDVTSEIMSVVEDGNQSIRILGDHFDEVQVTLYNQEGEHLLAVSRDGRAMVGEKGHDENTMAEMFLRANSSAARLVIRFIDHALSAENMDDARKALTLPHLEVHPT